MAGIGTYKPIKLILVSNSRDSNGDNIEVTLGNYKLWAEVENVSQSTSLVNAKSSLSDTKTFKFRFREDWILTTNWIIQYYGKIYSINSIERINEKRFNYLVTATGTYNTLTTPFTLLPNGTPVGGGGGGSQSGGGGGGGGGGPVPVTNFTAFTYNQATGLFTFSGGSGTANLQVSFLAYPFNGTTYVNGFNEGVSGQSVTGSTVTETNLTPGTLNIKWRRTSGPPSYTPLSDYQMVELVVTRLPQKPYPLFRTTGLKILISDFPVKPLNVNGVELATANTPNDYISIMNADPANAACFHILSYYQDSLLWFVMEPLSPYQNWGTWNRTLRANV